MKQNKQAFTLIELLVVILIIGILAAVALPQYTQAVNKSRVTQALTMLQTLTEAQEAYYLANNEYATELNDLDIDIPAQLRADTSDDAQEIPLSTANTTYLFHCKSGRSCAATAHNPNLPYIEFAFAHQPANYVSYSNVKWCVALDRIGSSKIAKNICRSMGTLDHEGDAGGGGYYQIN